MDDGPSDADLRARTNGERDPGERAQTAALPPAERQKILDTMLVETRQLTESLGWIARFHRPVRGGVHGRGNIGGLLGPSRTGKTTALRLHASRFGSIMRPDGEVPAIAYVKAGKEWRTLDLAVAVGRQVLGYPPRRQKAEVLFENIVEEIKLFGIEMVVIDDAQYLLASRYRETVNGTLGFLLQLADAKTCNVLVAGHPVIEDVISANDPVFNRGSFPHGFIDPHDWADQQSQDEFRTVLDEIDKWLPFGKRSNLASKTLSPHFYRVSGGLVGMIMNHVRPAAHLAMNEGAPCITTAHLIAASTTLRRTGDPYVPFHGTLAPGETVDRHYDPDEEEDPPAIGRGPLRRKTRSGIR